MRILAGGGTAALVAVSLVAAAACGDGGGGRRVVVREDVCGNVRLLRLELGESNRITLDNTQHGDNQGGLTLRMNNFPLIIRGEIPPNSVIGDPFSTVVLQAPPGEERSVEVEPTFTGTYTGVCGVTLNEPDGGVKIVSFDLTFELVE
jgi:hypothetical protein